MGPGTRPEHRAAGRRRGPGAAIGLGLGRLLVGDLPSVRSRRSRCRSLALVDPFAGGLCAVVVAQLGTLLTPGRDLLRRIPVRRTRWRRPLSTSFWSDSQSTASSSRWSSEGGSGAVGTARPGLAALALPWSPRGQCRRRDLAGDPCPVLGRARTVLIAALMARRPETLSAVRPRGRRDRAGDDRLRRLDTGNRTRRERAALEVGADRVITVDADDPARLREVVRRWTQRERGRWRSSTSRASRRPIDPRGGQRPAEGGRRLAGRLRRRRRAGGRGATARPKSRPSGQRGPARPRGFGDQRPSGDVYLRFRLRDDA